VGLGAAEAGAEAWLVALGGTMVIVPVGPWLLKNAR
jgi:hypothetical protein